MDKQSRNRLPKQCLFMNANGEIMRIEYGKSGFSRSELSTENRKANQVIVNSYNERHGITAEQINTMHQGALFGWDLLHLSRQEQSGMKSGRIFEVEISRPGSFGSKTSSTLTLPVAQYEILDALDKARITDERVIYSVEIIGCELDYLPQFIGTNANLYELNHLAERLSSLNEWELDCFEGMVMMDTIRTQYSPIAVDRLINMTHSMNESEGDRYGLVNELAQQLRHIKEENGVLTYKAMLETAPADISLEDALDLAFLTEEFEILSETASPADYAEKEVQRMMSFESTAARLVFRGRRTPSESAGEGYIDTAIIS